MNIETYKLFFQTMGNPNRLAILVTLYQKGTQNVSWLCENLKLEQSVVSHHLQCLGHCGFVNKQRRGKEIHYTLNPEIVIPLFHLVDQHMQEFCAHLGHCSILKTERNKVYSKQRFSKKEKNYVRI